MTWVANLVETMTGRIGTTLRMGAEGAWNWPINGVEEFDVTVSKKQLRELEPRWWTEFRTSVMISRVMNDGTLQPWMAGPIVEPPVETRGMATLQCAGIGELLARRVVLDRDYRPGEEEQLASSMLPLTQRSYGTIMQDVVRSATEGRLAGTIPMRYASPRQTGSRYFQRVYDGFNLRNNGAWKRLEELSKLEGGPDFQFRPEFVDERRTYMRWALFHGTAEQHAVAQEWTMDLDTTAARSPVSEIKVKASAASRNNRAYITGAGEGAGTLIRMAENVEQMEDGMPLLEYVGADSDSENAELLLRKARTAVELGAEAQTQITATANLEDARTELGRWRVGDLAWLTLAEGEWLQVPGGRRRYRVIAAKGTWGSPTVTLEFQASRAAVGETESSEEG